MDSNTKQLCARRVELKCFTMRRDILASIVSEKRKHLNKEKLALDKLTDDVLSTRNRYVEAKEAALQKEHREDCDSLWETTLSVQDTSEATLPDSAYMQNGFLSHNDRGRTPDESDPSPLLSMFQNNQWSQQQIGGFPAQDQDFKNLTPVPSSMETERAESFEDDEPTSHGYFNTNVNYSSQHAFTGGPTNQRASIGGTSSQRASIGGISNQRASIGGTLHQRVPTGGTSNQRAPIGGTSNQHAPIGGTSNQRTPIGGTSNQCASIGGNSFYTSTPTRQPPRTGTFSFTPKRPSIYTTNMMKK